MLMIIIIIDSFLPIKKKQNKEGLAFWLGFSLGVGWPERVCGWGGWFAEHF